MAIMKRLFFCILCFASTQGFAQIKVGVTAGLNTANFWETDGWEGLGTELSANPISAFHGGFLGETKCATIGSSRPRYYTSRPGPHLRNRQGLPNSGNFVVDFTNTNLRIYSLRLPGQLHL